MLEVLLCVTLFIIAPALSGYGANVYATPRKRVWCYRRYLIVKDWSLTRHVMMIFGFFAVVLYATGALAKLGMPLNPLFGRSLLGLTWLSGMAFLYCYFEISKLRDRLPWKSLAGLLAIGVATLSKVLADHVIAELTHLPPRELVGAQLLLSVIMTVSLWSAGVAIALGAVVFGSLFLMLRSMVRDYFSMRKKQKYDALPDLAAVVAIYLCALIALTAMAELSRKSTYEKPAREAIAFAAFTLPASYCGLSDKRGAMIAPLANDTAAIAIADDKLGYRFEPITCVPAKKSLAEIEALLGTSARQ
ncbi:MAG: hypothetical protein ACLGJA_21475 [Gammaproteobacteria bacterium]